MRERSIQLSADGPGADRQPRRNFFLRKPFPETEGKNIPLIVGQCGEGSLMVNALVQVRPVCSVVFCGVKLSEPGRASVVIFDARIGLADEKTRHQVKERVGSNALPNLGLNLLANLAGKIVIVVGYFCDDVPKKCTIPLVVEPLEDADAIAVWREEIDKFRHVCYLISEPGKWGMCEGAPSCQRYLYAEIGMTNYF